jgi:hypothetical protein
MKQHNLRGCGAGITEEGGGNYEVRIRRCGGIWWQDMHTKFHKHLFKHSVSML